MANSFSVFSLYKFFIRELLELEEYENKYKLIIFQKFCYQSLEIEEEERYRNDFAGSHARIILVKMLNLREFLEKKFKRYYKIDDRFFLDKTTNV